jgi:hypothetical protein
MASYANEKQKDQNHHINLHHIFLSVLLIKFMPLLSIKGCFRRNQESVSRESKKFSEF